MYSSTFGCQALDTKRADTTRLAAEGAATLRNGEPVGSQRTDTDPDLFSVILIPTREAVINGHWVRSNGDVVSDIPSTGEIAGVLVGSIREPAVFDPDPGRMRTTPADRNFF